MAKLFRTPIQVSDGSQGVDKVLTSDANGVGIWRTIANILGFTPANATGANATGTWPVSVTGSAKRIANTTVTTGAGIRITHPDGAAYTTTASTVTGAIKIKLPVASYKSNTMMRFTVTIYEYAGNSAGTSRTLEIGGYNYSDAAATWHNTFATMLSHGGAGINVRWGNDGTSQCVWIGETNTVWSYPQVFVTDFEGGYANATDAIWGTGWSITFVTAFDTVFWAIAAARFWHQHNDGPNTGLSADMLDDMQLSTLGESLRAGHAITGGGVVSVSASNEVKWTTRFIVISDGRGSHFSTSGYFDITCPAAGVVITGVGGASNVTVTASGIPLTTWHTLYYALPTGSGSGSLDANFRVVNYSADIEIPPNWVPLVRRNNDSTVRFYFPNGIILSTNQSLDMTAYDARNAANAAQVGGYSVNVGTTANTVPVRDANGRLLGDILGNAATATYANALYVSGNTYAGSFSAVGGTVPVRDAYGRIAAVREQLTADRIYYVRKDGNNNNTGLTYSSGGAFLTIQKAIDVVSALDLGIYNVFIEVQADAGVWSEAIALKSYVGSGAPTLRGYNGVKAQIQGGAGHAITGANCGVWNLDKLTLTSSSANAVFASGGTSRPQLYDITYGICAGVHIAAYNGAMCVQAGNYEISGYASWHYYADNATIYAPGRTVTFTSAMSFAGAFAYCCSGMINASGQTYVDKSYVTGYKYNVVLNGVIITNTGNNTTLPGTDGAYSASTGGQYY